METAIVYTSGALFLAAFLLRGVSKKQSSTDDSTFNGIDDGTANFAITRALSLQNRYGHGLGCRHNFFLDFSTATHLNHGSYGTAPRSVVRAAAREMEAIESWPDDFMRRRALGEVSRAADELGSLFFNAKPGSTVFVENATVGVNAVLRSVAAMLPKGKSVLIFDHTYNACKNAAYDMAEKAGLSTVTCMLPLPLPRGSKGTGSFADGLCELLNATLTAESGNVGLVLLDHITSPTGILMPVARLTAVARKHGAMILCDGAHAPGQIADINPSTLGVDWYVGNLHKWAFTLKGVAILWSSETVQSATQGSIISHFWKLDYQARHFMQGTLDYSRYLSAMAGVSFATTALGGFKAIQNANTALAEAGARILEEAWWGKKILPGKTLPRDLRLLSPDAITEGLSTPFLAVIRTPLNWRAWVRDSEGHDVQSIDDTQARAALLSDSGLPERISNACLKQPGRVQSVFYAWAYGNDVTIWCRISAQVYNTIEDYQALAHAVNALKLSEGYL